jgi:hypothetical protein
MDNRRHDQNLVVKLSYAEVANIIEALKDREELRWPQVDDQGRKLQHKLKKITGVAKRRRSAAS